MPPLRLAILEADTPVPAANDKYKGYFGVFKHLFARAVSPAPLESALALTGHDVVHNPDSSYPSLDDVDAILITGSKYNAFDDDDWIVTYANKNAEVFVGPAPQALGRALWEVWPHLTSGYQAVVRPERIGVKLTTSF